MILLVSDIGEHKANRSEPRPAPMIESKLDRGRGPVATILVQEGTLRVGDTFIAGPVVGRRARAHRRSRPAIKSAQPSNRWRCLACRPAASRARVPGLPDAAKARQIATLPPGTGRRRSRWAPRQPAHAGVAAAADCRRQHERPAHRLKRRAGHRKCWRIRCRS